MKNLFLIPIQGYQYISKMLPSSCRYYPTCSEYAKWQFELNTPSKAFFATSKRILSCNQLFEGGIDYPSVKYIATKVSCILIFNTDCGRMHVLYWLVPQSMNPQNKYYYIIKDFDAIKRST